MNLIDLLILGRLLQGVATSHLQAESRFDQQTTPAEVLILSELFRTAPLSIGDLATRTGFVQSHVSTLAARLAERDQVVLAPDPADRRRTLVSVHPQMLDSISLSLAHDATPLLADLVGADSVPSIPEISSALEVLLQHLRERYPHVDASLPTSRRTSG